MKYLMVNDIDIEQHPNLPRLMWTDPKDRIFHTANLGTHYVPEDHANIALIQMYIAIPIWRDLGQLTSNRLVKTII